MMCEIAGAGRGKWSQPGVPHKGWMCTDVEDLGDPGAVCEMCKSQKIRYVHYMKHPDYPDELGVGCVCAGHMGQDRDSPKRRERNLKNAHRRRNNWLDRNWRTSEKGNPYLNTDGFNVVVYENGDKWCYRVKDRSTSKQVSLYRAYDTMDQAKLAAFDRMIFWKDQQEIEQK